MTTNSNFLHLKVGVGLPVKQMEAGAIREKATRFYWGVFQLLNKDTHQLLDDQQARVLRLSFEDDYEEEILENDDYPEEDFEEEGFSATEDLLKADEERPDEESEELRDELFYK